MLLTFADIEIKLWLLQIQIISDVFLLKCPVYGYSTLPFT